MSLVILLVMKVEFTIFLTLQRICHTCKSPRKIALLLERVH